MTTEIGVTAWSLQIPESDFEGILKAVRDKLGLDIVQIGGWGFIKLDEKERASRIEAIHRHGIRVPSTTVAFAGESYADHATAIRTVGFYDPDLVEERFQHILDMAEMTMALDVHLLTTHIGHIPAAVAAPRHQHMIDVTRRICDMLGERNIDLGAEVGGLENAETLAGFIESVQRDNLKVNFDPANALRAGGYDPITELEILKPYVVGVHLKDALPLQASGVWGDEVALGQGEIGVESFVAKLKEIGFTGPLIIEREGGPDPIGDINRGAELLRRLI
jgi:sugar phosphate isomerase/epimerase